MKQKTIAEIRAMLSETAISQEVLENLRKDARKGVQQLVSTFERKQKKTAEMLQAEEEKRQFDRSFSKGNMLLAGVDEAGRGPLAGPVTAAAVILPQGFSLPGLTDSKQLTENERNRFYDIIKREAVAWQIIVIDRAFIDRVNIYEATKLAMKEAIISLTPLPEIALIDAVKLQLPEIETEAVIKGDDKSLAIAAASILAKVKRDAIMAELDEQYPVYEFAKNKGYGTQAHLEALRTYGPCSCHRRSFAPVSNLS